MNNGKLIQIDLAFHPENSKYSIVLNFRDSYQILLASLEKLGKSFNTECKKSIFPYDFVNDHSITLDYKGKVPLMKYFQNISKEEYNKYKQKFIIWSLKDEAIRYCINDCISLYQIILTFNNLIFDKWNININEQPTISSLSQRLYLTHFMNE